MKKMIGLSLVFLLSLFIIFCGGNQGEQTDTLQTQSESPSQINKEPAQKSDPRSLTKDDVMATNPQLKDKVAPKPTVSRGEMIAPENLQEGTCEYAAYWFAEYFTSGDSLKAYELCNDSMKNVVRQILQIPGQIKNMELNRAAGYVLDGVSRASESTADYCRACLQATHMKETREECEFYFEKINGKWLLCSFKK